MDILFARTEYPTLRLPATAGVEAACCQCVGDRDEQQDACGVFAAEQSMLAVVADGMGGLARGGAAARLALQTAQKEALPLLSGGANYQKMKAALLSINSEVYHCIDNKGFMGMAGTTLCAAVIEGKSLRLFWSGDSRVYLWRGGNLRQLTEDHIYARYLQEMLTEGVISQAEAQHHPSRSHLTGYIGMRELEDFSITAGALTLEKDDGLLLCTDGLYKCLEETQMCRCMGMGAAVAAEALIKLVSKKRLRGQDNATALVLKWLV
jgi:PPM family protein phosphatase